MKDTIKKLSLILLALAITLAFPLTASANSAEPPTMVVMVMNAPEDLTVELEIPDLTDEYIYVRKISKMWEQYFRIYYHGTKENLENARLLVSSSEKSFSCELPPMSEYNVYSYNTLLYLDFDAETLTIGQPVYREPLLIALRVSLTLIFEGLVFFLLGFRKKSSWIAFLIINLLTQGWLNISIAGASIQSDYIIFGFILYEIVIFIAEAIAVTAFVREHKWYRRLGFSLLANTVSLILGMVIISNLPI